MLAGVLQPTPHRSTSSLELRTSSWPDNHLQPVAREHGNFIADQPDFACVVLDVGEHFEVVTNLLPIAVGRSSPTLRRKCK